MDKRDKYIKNILANIRAVERINTKNGKPWNYRLKGLGRHLVGKAHLSFYSDRINDIDSKLHNIDKKLNKLNSDTSDSDDDKLDPNFKAHPVAYTVDDSLGCLGVALVIIAIGVCLHIMF